MRSLQNFKGFHSNGRVLYPAGFTFSSVDVYIECGADPQWGNAFTFAGTEFASYSLRVRNISPALTFGNLTVYNLC